MNDKQGVQQKQSNCGNVDLFPSSSLGLSKYNQKLPNDLNRLVFSPFLRCTEKYRLILENEKNSVSNAQKGIKL